MDQLTGPVARQSWCSQSQKWEERKGRKEKKGKRKEGRKEERKERRKEGREGRKVGRKKKRFLLQEKKGARRARTQAELLLAS